MDAIAGCMGQRVFDAKLLVKMAGSSTTTCALSDSLETRDLMIFSTVTIVVVLGFTVKLSSELSRLEAFHYCDS